MAKHAVPAALTDRTCEAATTRLNRRGAPFQSMMALRLTTAACWHDLNVSSLLTMDWRRVLSIHSAIGRKSLRPSSVLECSPQY